MPHSIDRCLYVFRMEGTDFYKIGIANDPFRRLKEVDRMSPTPVNVVWCKANTHLAEQETLIHRKYAAHHVRLEWFRFTEEEAEMLFAELDMGAEFFLDWFRTASVKPRLQKGRATAWTNPLDDAETGRTSRRRRRTEV